MEDWKLRLESRMLEIASGDDLKMERMREILSWFVEKKDMQAAASAFRRLTEAEDLRLAPSGMPVGSLRMLLWAMEEGKSDNPKQAMKWKAFCSRRRAPAGPSEEVVGAVMALPTPGSARLPVVIESDEEAGGGAEAAIEPDVDPMEEFGPPTRKKKGKAIVYMPRRSPRFPRRLPRLLSLARSAAAE